MSIDLDTRIENLESRFAFQEHSLETLNTIVIEQQKRIDELVRNNTILSDRVRQIITESGMEITEVEKPPHY